MKIQLSITLMAACLLVTSCDQKTEKPVSQAETTYESIKSKYNTDIPDKILTLDKVDTRIGELNFFDGLPSEETTKKVYDNLDFMRGVETFLNGIPATSIEGLRIGMAEVGVKKSNQVGIFR